MRLAVGEREPALRDGPADGGAVREHKFHLPLRREADVLPYRVGEQRVGRSAVDEEANAGFLTGRTADGALDVADTHAPEDGILVRQRRHPKIAGRGKATPGERKDTRPSVSPKLRRRMPVHGQGRAASSLAIGQILASTVAIIVVVTK